MNAKKYLRSRLGITIEQIKRAYLSNRHICFLVCTEPEFIKEIIDSESFFPNQKPEKTDSKSNVRHVTEDDFITKSVSAVSMNDNLDIVRPLLYLYESQTNQLPLQSLTNYVNHITFLSSCNYELSKRQMQRIKCLKDSLIIIPVETAPQIPAYIEPYSGTIVVPFMGEDEFKEYVSLYISKTENASLKVNINGYQYLNNEDFLKKLYHNMRGLNATQIKSILRENQVLFGSIYKEDSSYDFSPLIRNVRKTFERLIESSSALSLEESTMVEPAGLGKLSDWLKKHNARVAEPHKFETVMLEAPKGLLITGIPGTGKSMMAKYVAGYFGLSLVRLDFGNLGGKYVGSSEKNMDNALNLIEALSPCVLWVDEMEKAFSEANGNSAHEVTKRLLGKFMTWMQERGRRGVSCFVFATANDISKMPPEMFRSGRFDDKFYTFMPTAEECAKIFEKNINEQCERYRKVTSQNLQAKPLFNQDRINGIFFRNLLNDHNLCLLGFPKNISQRNVNRLNKFFIGADIDQLIKNAKNDYLVNYSKNNNTDAFFDSDLFACCLKKSIQELQTYGQTNLMDIVKCYAQLVLNNFQNASAHSILPFEAYDDISYQSAADNENVYLYDMNRYCEDAEQKHYNALADDYDKCMYLIIRNAINQLAPKLSSI